MHGYAGCSVAIRWLYGIARSN